MNRDSDAHTDARTAPLVYTLPSSSGTLWLGLGPAALAALGVTLLATVLLMLTGAPLWLSLIVAALGAATSAWPVSGRSSLQWLPLLTRHLAQELTRRSTWTCPWPNPGTPRLNGDFDAGTEGIMGVDPAGEGSKDRCLRLPRSWGRWQVSAGEDPTVGLLLNRTRGTATVLLEVTGPGHFGLLDPHAQDSELGRWGSTLATLLALPEVRHLQWLTHTRPQPLPPATAHHPVGDAASAASSGLVGDYAHLVAHAHAEALVHLHLLALTFTTSLPKTATATDDVAAHAATVRELLRQASAALLAADLLCCPVSSDQLPGLLRLLLDPTLPNDMPPGLPPDLLNDLAADQREHDQHDQPDQPDQPEQRERSRRTAEAVLLSLRPGWSSCQTDDTHHRVYAVTRWPRVALPADWLAPLLHHPPTPGTARTLVVHARPIAAQHAARRARATTAKARLDAGDRQRLGFTPAAGNALDELDAENTEAELLAGYRMADLTALLTVHAPDADLLQSSARNLTALTVSQRIDLRPLHGQHPQALAATLPIGLLPGARS